MRYDAAFVDGSWIPVTGPSVELVDPATEEPFAVLGLAARAEADAAARAAFGGWQVADRAAVLRRVREGVAARRAEFGAHITQDMGCPPKIAEAVQVGALLAGLPPGVCNVVVGTGSEVGAALAADPGVDMVSFTGSTAAGRLVGRAAADTVKRVALELGGKSASVLLPDAGLPKAVKATVNNAFLNSGQTCTAWTRLLVHRDQHDEVATLAGQLADGMASRLGPFASKAQWTEYRATCRPPRRGWSPAVQDASTATTVGTSAARPSTPTCPRRPDRPGGDLRPGAVGHPVHRRGRRGRDRERHALRPGRRGVVRRP